MKVRFQADADLNQIIVTAVLRLEPSVDFRTAHAANLAGLADPAVLSEAARAGRMLVSHDRRTLPAHFGQFVLNEKSPGVIIVPQRLPIQRAAEDLHLIWAVTEAEEWVNRIFCLPI